VLKGRGVSVCLWHLSNIAPKLSSDAGCDLYDAGAMDEKAIRRAALVTLKRAILERFPPGPERRAWLRWAAGL
jgi:hypothetical protein